MQETTAKAERPVVIFLDVYHTLLDLSDIERRVNILADSKRGFTVWFELFMQYCFVENCTSRFNDFHSIARATLEMSMSIFSRKLSAEDIDITLELFKHLPLHENVPEGLSKLNDFGFRLVALTNAPYSIVMERMERTGLVSYFEQVLCAEQVKKYKPCIEVYDWAIKTLGIQPQQSILVSSHSWDIAGASNAGMQTAILAREKEVLYPLMPSPHFHCNSLVDLAIQLDAL